LTPVAGFADHASIEKGVHDGVAAGRDLLRAPATEMRVGVFVLSLAIDGTDVSWSA